VRVRQREKTNSALNNPLKSRRFNSPWQFIQLF